MRLRSGKELIVGINKRKRSIKTRCKTNPSKSRSKQKKGQNRPIMTTSAEYKDILTLIEQGTQLGFSLQEAMDEAVSQFEADTDELRTLIKLHNIMEIKTLEPHGYRMERAPTKLLLFTAYKELGLEQESVKQQTQKHLGLGKARSETVEAAIQANIQREEKERERRHEETKFKHEETIHTLKHETRKLEHDETMKKMEFDNEDRKRKHESELVRMTRQKTFTTSGTRRIYQPEDFYRDVLHKAKTASSIQGMFDMVERCVSGKLSRRGHTPPPTTQVGTMHHAIDHDEFADMPPMIVANKLNEYVQYDMLTKFNATLDGGHFCIDDTSTTTLPHSRKRVDNLAVLADDVGKAKSAVNIAFMVEQKADDGPKGGAFHQLAIYLESILKEAGPRNAEGSMGRTHAMGILVYRLPLSDELAPPENTDTIPAVEVTARHRKRHKEEGPKKGYSRLVAEVFVLFHETFMPEPSFIRLAEPMDAARLFAILGSKTTKYSNIQRSYAVNPFSVETIKGVTYKCLRYLGPGAGTTDVWECVEDNAVREEPDEEYEPYRISTNSSNSDLGDQLGESVRIPVWYNTIVLKRCKGEYFQHEADMLRRLAHAFPIDAGLAFPKCVENIANEQQSFLLSKPVCSKLLRGTDIRRAHYSPTDKLQPYLDHMGQVFVNYLDTLQKCHQVANVVHRDIALHNLMVSEQRQGPHAGMKVTRHGCIIDWECAAELDPTTHEYEETHAMRVSLQTVSDRYLDTRIYRPSDDLIALIRCWKLATQLPTYKLLKEWSRLAPDRQQMEDTIRLYWRHQRGKLERLAERTDYDGLRAYFGQPHYIPPITQSVSYEIPEYYDDNVYNVRYGGDEKQREPECLQCDDSFGQYTHTLVDSQTTVLPDDFQHT